MKVTKKLLSVLLAVMMIVSSISVCFGTVSFAAGGTASAAQWNALASALANDTVKNATFSGSTNNYTVSDPDGKILAAVEAYWSVFETLANKTPASGNPSNNTNVTGSTEGNRTINQVNDSIKAEMSSRMGAGYTDYNVATFLTKLMSGASVSAGTGTEKGGEDTTDDSSAPGTNLNAVSDIKLTVMLESAITGYSSVDELPAKVVTSKSFTVKHGNDKFDYAYSTRNETTGSGCNQSTTTYHKETYKYFYYISGTSSANGAEMDTQILKASGATLAQYADYFSKNMDELYATEAATLDTVSSAVSTAKQNVVNGFGAGVFAHFFSAYTVDTLVNDIATAKEVQVLAPKLLKAYEDMEKGYADIITDKAALTTLVSTMTTAIDAYNAATAAARAYCTTKGFIVADVTAFRTAVLREIELINLRELIAEIQTGIVPYITYNEAGIDEGTVTTAMIGAAITNIAGWQTRLAAFKDADIADIGGADFKSGLTAVKSEMDYLKLVAGYNDDFAAEYSKFAAEIFSVTDANGDVAVILEALQNYDGWYTGLKALTAEMKSVLGAELAEELFDGLNDVMVNRMDDAYVALNASLESQIDFAYDLFTAYTSTYGEAVHMASISEYRAMQASIGLINTDVYNYLNGTAHFNLSADAVAKYTAMQKKFTQYDSFLASHGFSTYKTSEIADLVRPDTEKDIARENEGGVYTTSDAQIEKIIELLDAALANDEVKNLLGGLINKDKETGEPTGEPFDLVTLLNGLIEGIYSDSLINTIVQYVYPLVCKEFAKVWAGLPSTFSAYNVETGVSLAPTANVENCPLYLNDVEESIAAVGLYLSPVKLAANLKNNSAYSGYTQVIAKLQTATTKAVYTLNGEGDEDDTFTNPWEDASLFKNVYDEETGEQIFNDDGTPKQVYDLVWGVDEAEDKRAAFIDAACAALSGLEPLLMAIISDTTYVNPDTTGTSARGSKIGTGKGTASVKALGFLTLDLNLNIDPITLVLNFKGNDGWDNALVPIFEALGLENIPHSHELNTTRKLLENGLFAMIDQLIDKVAEAPVTFILEALPNLCYALEAGLVAPLLNMLKTEISYFADAYYTGSLGSYEVAASVLKNAMESTEPIKINIGEMINLADMGLDISSFQAIWDMIAGGVELLDGVAAPNAGYLATLGTLVEKNTNRSEKTYEAGTAGKAYHINANKADVLLYLLTYVINSGLLGKFNLPAEGIVADIIASLQANPDNILAAIVELFNLGKYDTLADYTWYEGDVNAEGETVTGLTPAMVEYLSYDNDWTKEKAEYLINNVDAIIAAVAGEEFDLGTMIGDATSTLFTNKNITAIASLLSMLDINALLAGDKEEAEETPDANEPETVEEGEEEATEAPAIDVAALLKAFAGLDFSKFADYKELAEDTTWGFEDGDAAGFVAALVELLAPLKPVLDFILADADLEIALSADDKVTLVGYNGYDSAIVPVLEALGCEVEALGDNDALTLILTALVAKLDAIVANPINEILDILPGVIYFIQSNGLATVVRNLLQPIYVILDTIRPIYDLDIAALLAGIEINGQPLSINLDDLSWNFIINDLLPNFLAIDLGDFATLIADVCKVIGVEYTSASSVVGTGMKGAYNDNFDKADLLTVIVCFALEWIQKEGNADSVAALIAGEDAEKEAQILGYINGAFNVIKGIDPAYDSINWAYNFPEGFDEAIFDGGISIAPSIESLTYPTDWTEESAKYISDNLDAIVAQVLELAKVEGSLSDLLKANINIFNAETLKSLIALIADLLTKVDATLVETIGVALDADIDAIVNYEVSEDIDTAEEFFAALADILSNIQNVVDWLFFGRDFTLFNTSTGADAIVLKGAEGYAYGLAPILEALGVAAPAKDEATVANVLNAIAVRYDAIIADPVNEVFELLPNIIYFLNANGVSVSVKNLLAGVIGLMAAVEENFGVELDIFAIINDALNGLLPEDSEVVIDAANLDLATIIALVEALVGIDLSIASKMLVNFCVGTITPYTSASGEYGFKMGYDDEFARYDMITILVTVALVVFTDDDNEAALGELIGADILAAIKSIFAGGGIEYTTPDWDYALADNGTVDAMKYSITYPNNWTKETAEYVTEVLLSEEFDALIAGLIGEEYASLSDLLNDKVNVFTTETLNSLVGTITGLIADIDDTLLGVGMILDVKLPELKAYKAPEGIATTAAFAAELANILNTYAPGLVEWLLLGRDFKFFVDESKIAEGVNYDKDKAIITISGAHGYAEGLALLLEALGCEDLPDVYNENLTTEEIINRVLASVAARIDAIFADPINEVVELLPNILYFLNTNGVAAVVDNLTAALMAVVNKLGAFGVELSLNDLVNLRSILKIEDTDATISVDNLAMADILQAVSYMTGLDLTLVEDVLVGFALGQVDEYDSVSMFAGAPKKMTYKSDFEKYDMVTVLANLVLLTFADEANADFLKNLMGEELYLVILSFFNMEKSDMQKFSWMLTERADTDYVFSALASSELYADAEYGPLYTEEMAQYIADNFGEFVDNIIYLLGIQIEGKTVDNLKDLINGLVNGNVYNSANVVAIRDALAGVLASIGDLEVNGKNVGKYITAVLAKAGIADFAAVAAVEVPEFTEDRAQFVEYLCKVIEPLYPVLKLVLADSKISFFVDLDQNDAVTILGAEGYAYGIIPLLETLECENILAPEAYYAAVEDDANVLLTSILNPLLDRVDEILANPADEILNMLPNLIYFINSNGVDTVVKNTLNAVFTILDAIAPIAKIDLYEIIGVDLADIDFDWLFNKLLALIADLTGYEFDALDANAIVELTVGTLESYTSLNGETAYKMVYANADDMTGGKAEMVTVVMRLLVTFIMHENNQEMLLGLLKDTFGMTPEAEKFVGGVLYVIAECATETYLGMDQALATLYYLFYGADIGVTEVVTGYKDLNAEWTQLLKDMVNSDNKEERIAGEIITELLDLDLFEDIIDSEDGIAPNGLIAFFMKIVEWFQKIVEWFKGLFA